MAGKGQFEAANGPDRLTAAGKEFGFSFLSNRQVPPAVIESVTTPGLDAGRYIMPCNVRAHYQNFNMFGQVQSLDEQKPQQAWRGGLEPPPLHAQDGRWRS